MVSSMAGVRSKSHFQGQDPSLDGIHLDDPDSRHCCMDSMKTSLQEIDELALSCAASHWEILCKNGFRTSSLYFETTNVVRAEMKTKWKRVASGLDLESIGFCYANNYACEKPVDGSSAYTEIMNLFRMMEDWWIWPMYRTNEPGRWAAMK